MPTVPRYSQPQVETAPLPGVRRQGGAPSGAFQPPAPVDLSGVTSIVAQMAERETQKADQIALLDADNQLSKLRTDLSVGALNRRGKDALGASLDLEQPWRDGVAAIDKGLSGERQRQAFRNRVSQSWAGLYEQVERHASGEAKRYDDDSTVSFIGNRLSDAISYAEDPEKRAHAIAEGKVGLSDYAKRNGMAPEVLKEKQAEFASRAHLGIIDRMLTNGQDIGAKHYYDEIKGELRGEDVTRVERALDVGTTEGTALRTVDAIWGKLGPKSANDPVKVSTMEEAIREQHGDEPKVIKAAIAELRSRASAFNAEQNELTASNKASVLGRFNQGASLADLVRSPAYRALSGTDQEQVKSYIVGQSRQLSEYAEDARTRRGFRAYWEKSDPAELATMSENQILALEPELGRALTGRLMEKKRSLDVKEDRVFAATIDDDQFKKLARAAGLPNPYGKLDDDEKATLGQLKSAVEDAIGREQEQKGKALTREEKGTVMQSVIDQKVMLDVFGSDEKKTLATLSPDQIEQAYVPLADIKTSHLVKVTNRLRSLIVVAPTVTDAALRQQYQRRIERAYFADLNGAKNDEIDSILRGAK